MPADQYNYWSGSAFKEIQGWNRVKNSFRKIIRANQTYFREVNRRWAVVVKYHLSEKPYPPERFQQKYVRTGRLGTSFRFRTDGDQVKFYNDATNKHGFMYAELVLQKDFQAWFHRYRWWTIEDAVEPHIDELRRLIYRAIERDFVQ